MRVHVSDELKFPKAHRELFMRAEWPAKWVTCAGCERPSFVAAYRLRFEMEKAATVRVHVTADQRYELFLDGQRIGRGPERGDVLHWFYESHDLELARGAHVLVAKVWALRQDDFSAPTAQVSFRPGFMLAAEAPFTEKLSTGIARWEAKRLEGYEFQPPSWAGAGGFAGGTVKIDGRSFSWGFERGEGDGWPPVIDGKAARERINKWGEVDTPRLTPAMLPAMMEETRTVGTVRFVEEPAGSEAGGVVDPARNLADETGTWQALVEGQKAQAVPARTRRRLIIDLGNYYCAYPEVTLSGGRDATVRLLWAEALYEVNGPGKGNRDQINGKKFVGRGDTFVADGGQGRTFSNLWWNAGRYLELCVETADEPLTIDALAIRETRYPLEMQTELNLSEERFNRAVPIMWRTLQMCSHETYMDCPYYEQLMYTGDTRLEVLVTYLTSRDDRLPRKAITMFDASRWNNGLSQARYPCHLQQIIPQFSLFWVGMVYDYAAWRGDREMVGRMMPGVRAVLERFIASIDDKGQLVLPEGWDWVDWVPGWNSGYPPHDSTPYSAINNWQLVMILGLAAELERWIGEKAFADRYERVRQALAKSTTAMFWDKSRGLFADTPSKNSFSEHAQCYAILSGLVDEKKRKQIEQGLLSSTDLARATIYFQYYLFETFWRLGRVDAMLKRLGLWYQLPDQGFKTALESPEPSRSDCHAWSAHPIYHAYASIMGIRPAGLGFEKVMIEPQLAEMTSARGSVVHPKGVIEVDLKRGEEKLVAKVKLPRGVSGTLVYAGKRHKLNAGRQTVTVPLRAGKGHR